jgi:hypothetical protein
LNGASFVPGLLSSPLGETKYAADPAEGSAVVALRAGNPVLWVGPAAPAEDAVSKSPATQTLTTAAQFKLFTNTTPLSSCSAFADEGYPIDPLIRRCGQKTTTRIGKATFNRWEICCGLARRQRCGTGTPPRTIHNTPHAGYCTDRLNPPFYLGG